MKHMLRNEIEMIQVIGISVFLYLLIVFGMSALHMGTTQASEKPAPPKPVTLDHITNARIDVTTNDRGLTMYLVQYTARTLATKEFSSGTLEAYKGNTRVIGDARSTESNWIVVYANNSELYPGYLEFHVHEDQASGFSKWLYEARAGYQMVYVAATLIKSTLPNPVTFDITAIRKIRVACYNTHNEASPRACSLYIINYNARTRELVPSYFNELDPQALSIVIDLKKREEPWLHITSAGSAMVSAVLHVPFDDGLWLRDWFSNAQSGWCVSYDPK